MSLQYSFPARGPVRRRPASGSRRAGPLLWLLMAIGAPAAAQTTQEPNVAVPEGVIRYAATAFPDRIVASPAQDASAGFAVAWRTDTAVDSPCLEIAVARDTPAVDQRQRIQARSRLLNTENGPSHHHRADVHGLQADTLYMYRVQGRDTWSPWLHLRTAPAATDDKPLTLLYFGDTQNQNVSLSSRVIREALRHAPDASAVLHAGDLVNGWYGRDDSEWGEWFDATAPLSAWTLTAPAIGNHEYHREGADTPRPLFSLGAQHWPVSFALPENGAQGLRQTTYWFDIQDVRVIVLDGTSALEHGTASVQAQWLDRLLSDNPRRWSMVLIHQPVFSPRIGRDYRLVREYFMPVIERHQVDLVLQGHDHVYGRRSGPDPARALPQYILSVVGAKQYRVTDEAKAAMPVHAEDTQLFQVIRIDAGVLAYEARTATGRLYDAFEIRSSASGDKTLVELEDGRIDRRLCPRPNSLTGNRDRCWE